MTDSHESWKSWKRQSFKKIPTMNAFLFSLPIVLIENILKKRRRKVMIGSQFQYKVAEKSQPPELGRAGHTHIHSSGKREWTEVCTSLLSVTAPLLCNQACPDCAMVSPYWMDFSWQWCHHIGWTDRDNSLKTDARANPIWTSSYRDFLLGWF